MIKTNRLPEPPRSENNRGRARARHFDFVQWCWQRPDPFIEAKENPFQREICDYIDQAIWDYRNGISTFLCLNLAFRHGKSDISSRYLPPHFLGEFPDSEVMVISHTDSQVNRFGDFGRRLLLSPQYHELYPHISLSESKHGTSEWGLQGYLGVAQYSGIQSGIAGTGGNLIIIDDFFGKREHAESLVTRDKVWVSFTDDVMTRRAPVTIVLMVVTPWHVDDPIGRIKNRMYEDPKFPRFKFVNYPAESPKYKKGWLFVERFPIAWYESQKQVLGLYGFQSLMQCDPRIRGGNLLRTDKIHIVAMDGQCSCGQKHEWPRGFLEKRAWDLASSVKQTQKDDPDFTSGPRGFVKFLPTAVEALKVPVIYISDWIRGQWEAVQRQTIIRDTAIADGTIQVGIEAFGAYKDAYTELCGVLKGIRSVRKTNLPGDKQIKASPMVPVFEAGNVYFRKAPWNEPVIQQLTNFPSGDHDDDVDSLAVLFQMWTRGRISFDAA